MRLFKAGLAAAIAYAVAIPCRAGDGQSAPSGLSVACQDAHKAMKACMLKTIAAGAPESIRSQWERQIADSVKMWRALRGRPEVEKMCKDIAAKPDCED